MVRRPLPTSEKRALAFARKIEARAKPLQAQIDAALIRLLRAEIKRALGKVKGVDRILKTIGLSRDEMELARLIAQYGIRISEEAAEGIGVTFGTEDRWKVPPRVVRDILKTKQIRIKEWLREGRTDLVEELRDVIRDATERNVRMTNSALTRTIFDRMRDKGAFSPARAELIARTETAQAENQGIYAGMEMSGIKRIQWIAIRDGRARPEHAAMHGKTVAIGEDFVLPDGTRMRYPADPNGPIRHIAQCRCSISPVIE